MKIIYIQIGERGAARRTSACALARTATPMGAKWLTKLWDLLQKRAYHSCIKWNASGNGFIIVSVNEFKAKALPATYTSKEYNAFLRSLSYYSFTRTPGNDIDSCEYTHPIFHRDHPERIDQVRGRPLVRIVCKRCGRVLCVIGGGGGFCGAPIWRPPL